MGEWGQDWGADGSGGQIGTGMVRSDGSRCQIRRLGPGESGRLRVGSDGMGVSARLQGQG